MRSMYFQQADTKVYNPLPGVLRRQAAVGEDAQIVEFRLDKGAVIPPHHHPNEQIGMVISGSIVLNVGAKRRTIGPGDGYSIPRDQEHSVDVLEDSVVIDVFSPPRDDYRD